MADIFREIDEEVRRDRAIQFWRKYQYFFIALAVLIVAAAGAWRYYDTRKRAEAEAAGARYESALQLARTDKVKEADAIFSDLAAKGPAGYAVLSRFRKAADLGKSDKAAAVALYESLVNDASIGPVLQDVARLRAAMLRIDDADAQEIKNRLDPLTRTAGPFRNSARELLAISAMKNNDMADAAKWFDAITIDPDAPPDMRERAEQLMGLVGPGAAP
jgi:hypothetical protein